MELNSNNFDLSSIFSVGNKYIFISSDVVYKQNDTWITETISLGVTYQLRNQKSTKVRPLIPHELEPADIINIHAFFIRTSGLRGSVKSNNKFNQLLVRYGQKKMFE